MIDVVVADDDDSARATLVRVLSRSPEVRVVGEAADGETAVAQVRALRPDVVLLDVHMPGVDGVEAAHRLRSAADGTPIVFLTADPDAAAPGLKMPSTALLVKSAASIKETIAAVTDAAQEGAVTRRAARRARRGDRPA